MLTRMGTLRMAPAHLLGMPRDEQVLREATTAANVENPESFQASRGHSATSCHPQQPGCTQVARTLI
jgi:hypothetical protein